MPRPTATGIQKVNSYPSQLNFLFAEAKAHGFEFNVLGFLASVKQTENVPPTPEEHVGKLKLTM